jgi:hypothetical protein
MILRRRGGWMHAVMMNTDISTPMPMDHDPGSSMMMIIMMRSRYQYHQLVRNTTMLMLFVTRKLCKKEDCWGAG